MTYVSVKALKNAASAAEVEGNVAVQILQVQRKSTRTRKPYLEIVAGDAEDRFAFKVWNDAPWYAEFAALQPGETYSLCARWRSGEYGMEAAGASLRPLSSEEEESFWSGSPALREKQIRDRQTVSELCASVSDPRLRCLCRLFLERFGALFERAAAARSYHHARRGGLVEHVACMMRCAFQICEAYPCLNRDLLLAGCLFHDCGKLWENNYGERDLVMPYAEMGEMLGHIAIGVEIVNKLWREALALPEAEEWKEMQPPSEQVRLHLLHLIASHHGELQFGSPVPPKTPEAVVLHHVDDLDAKLEMFRDAYETSPVLAPHIRQRRIPLPGNVIISLPKTRAAPGNPSGRECRFGAEPS